MEASGKTARPFPFSFTISLLGHYYSLSVSGLPFRGHTPGFIAVKKKAIKVDVLE